MANMIVPRKIVPEITQAGLPNVTQRIDTPDAMFGDGGKALSRGADALERLGTQLDKVGMDMLEKRNSARVLELDNMARREAMDAWYNPENGILSKKGGNALDAYTAAQAKMAEIRDKYSKMDGEVPAVRDMMSKSLASLEGTMLEKAQQHQFTETNSYTAEQLNGRLVVNAEEAAANFNDEDLFQNNFEDTKRTLRAKQTQEGWSDQTFNIELQKEYSSMRSSQLTALLNQGTPDAIIKAKGIYDESVKNGRFLLKDAAKLGDDIDAVYNKAIAQKTYQTLGPATASGFDDVASFVLNRLEGGDKVVKDGKGMAKFGINTAANPDVDLSKLDFDGAKKLAKERYWDAIDADNLPENMRAVAFDTAFNHGPEKAKELIKKADGDPQKLIQLRFQEYQRLAKADPQQYGPQFKGWVNRLSTISNTMFGEPDTNTIAKEVARLNLESPGAGDELLTLHTKSLEARDKAKKAEKTDVQDKIMELNFANNGDYTRIPAELRSRAARLGIDITEYKGVSAPDMINNLDSMSSDELASVDLNDPSIAKFLNFSDKQTYIKKQNELLKPENKFMADQVDSVVNYYFTSTYGNPDKNKNTKAQVAAMKKYVEFRVQSFKDAGKTPTKQDITSAAAEYIKTSKSFGSGVGMTSKDIPDDVRENIEKGILAAGKIPTEGAVVAIYLKSKSVSNNPSMGSSIVNNVLQTFITSRLGL